MKKVRRKTDEERKKETIEKFIKVSDTDYYYWVCDICNVAFFGDDQIIVSSDGYKKCPLVTIGFLGKTKACKNHIYGGDEKCFDTYYKIKKDA